VIQSNCGKFTEEAMKTCLAQQNRILESDVDELATMQLEEVKNSFFNEGWYRRLEIWLIEASVLGVAVGLFGVARKVAQMRQRLNAIEEHSSSGAVTINNVNTVDPQAVLGELARRVAQKPVK